MSVTRYEGRIRISPLPSSRTAASLTCVFAFDQRLDGYTVSGLPRVKVEALCYTSVPSDPFVAMHHAGLGHVTKGGDGVSLALGMQQVASQRYWHAR